MPGFTGRIAGRTPRLDGLLTHFVVLDVGGDVSFDLGVSTTDADRVCCWGTLEHWRPGRCRVLLL